MCEGSFSEVRKDCSEGVFRDQKGRNGESTGEGVSLTRFFIKIGTIWVCVWGILSSCKGHRCTLEGTRSRSVGKVLIETVVRPLKDVLIGTKGRVTHDTVRRYENVPGTGDGPCGSREIR